MASYNHYQPVSSNTWIIPHNLNSTFLALDVFALSGGGVYQKIQPTKVQVVDSNNISVQLSSGVAGRARIVSRTN